MLVVLLTGYLPHGRRNARWLSPLMFPWTGVAVAIPDANAQVSAPCRASYKP